MYRSSTTEILKWFKVKSDYAIGLSNYDFLLALSGNTVT